MKTRNYCVSEHNHPMICLLLCESQLVLA